MLGRKLIYKTKPKDLMYEIAAYLSVTAITKPFWQLIDRLPQENRELLKSLTSDDIKDDNWIHRHGK